MRSELSVGCIVAIDVGKTRFVVAVATSAGDVRALVRFEHPRQTRSFLKVLEELRDAGLEPRVVMEPTGTYGDALRHPCHVRAIAVHMMPPKHTHDFAEVLDGVPSMHDAKAAVVLAKLQAIKPARAWARASDEQRDLRAWVDQRRFIGRTLAIHYGHLEAMMSRHWPEAESHIDVYRQRSWTAMIAAEPDVAKQLLRKASRGHFDNEDLDALIASAKNTMGVPMTGGEQEKLRAIVEQIEQHVQRLAAVDSKLSEFVENNDVLRHYASISSYSTSAASAVVCSFRSYPSACYS